MFRFLGIFAIIVAFGSSVINCCHDTYDKARPYINKVVNEFGPTDLTKSVVMLVAAVEPEGDGNKKFLIASGFAVDKDYILTAAHWCEPVAVGMLMGTARPNIDLRYLDNLGHDQTMLGSRIISFDSQADICLVERVDHGLLVVPVAKSVRRYDKVMTIGAPAGFFPVRTRGEVAIPNIDIAKEKDKKLQRIVITAPAFSGNSGGPAFNTRGEVIGMVVSKINYEHVIMLVPCWELNKFLKANVKSMK